MIDKVVLTDIATVDNGSINKAINLGSKVVNGIYMVKVKADGNNKTIRFTLER